MDRRSFLKALLLVPIAAPVIVQACVQAYRRWSGERALARLARGVQSGLQSPSVPWFRLKMAQTPTFKGVPVEDLDVAPDDGQWLVNWSGGITHHIGPKVQADRSEWAAHWREISRDA